MSKRSAKMAPEFFKREQVSVPEWLSTTLGIVQLILSGAAIIGAAIIWKLYVANLRAAGEAKDATTDG